MTDDAATTAPAARYDVILAGKYFCDMIFTGLPRMPQMGEDLYSPAFDMVPGGAFYTALAMHRLGLKSAWAVDLGNDFFSGYMRDAMRREGLDERLIQFHDFPVRRLAAALSFPHDRAFVSFVDPAPPLPLAEMVRQHRPRCLFLASLQTGPNILEIIQATHAAGGQVFMDCQTHHTTLDAPEVADVLRQLDIFAPNELEAVQLTGAPTPEEALDRLSEYTPVVVIKRGAQGALAQAGSERRSVPAIPAQVVDTTGAGDSFNAGFLYSYLRGEPLEGALRMGNVCGGLSVTGPGGSRLPTLAQAQTQLGWYGSPPPER